MIKIRRTNTLSWKYLLLTGTLLGTLAACGGGGGNGGGIPDPDPTPEPEPEVTTGQVSFAPDWGSLPASSALRIHFYPASGTVITKDVDSKGFSVELEAGAYKVLAYNTDATGVTYENTGSYATASVRVSPVETPTRASSFLGNPGNVYALAMESLSVEKGGTVSQSPSPVLLTRTVNLHFSVVNGGFVSNLSGYMNGLLPSVLLSTGTPDEASRASAPDCGAAFTVSLSGEEGTASFTALGLLDPANGQAYTCALLLAAETTDGQEWEVAADLSSTLTDILSQSGGVLPANEPLTLNLRVNASSAGLSAEVAGWKLGPSGDGTLEP